MVGDAGRWTLTAYMAAEVSNGVCSEWTLVVGSELRIPAGPLASRLLSAWPKRSRALGTGNPVGSRPSDISHFANTAWACEHMGRVCRADLLLSFVPSIRADVSSRVLFSGFSLLN